MKKDGCFVVGKIVGVHGIRGNLKLHSYIESLSLLASGESVFVGNPANEGLKYTIRWAKPHHRTMLLSLEDVEDRDGAEALVGRDVYLEKSRLPVPEEGSYYWSDLIGMAVVTMDKKPIGSIASIFRTGSNDVYVVQDGTNEILVPALVSVVKTVDLENGVMTVDLPEGLT